MSKPVQVWGTFSASEHMKPVDGMPGSPMEFVYASDYREVVKRLETAMAQNRQQDTALRILRHECSDSEKIEFINSALKPNDPYLTRLVNEAMKQMGVNLDD